MGRVVNRHVTTERRQASPPEADERWRHENDVTECWNDTRRDWHAPCSLHRPVQDFSLEVLLAAFATAALLVGVVGTRITRLAELIAQRTGLGQALIGTVLLGAVTSLPGLVTSGTAAAAGNPELSLSNAFGGIAAQTFFLALADVSHRGANLEHSAASIENLTQCGLLVLLLSLCLFFVTGPEMTLLGVHPGSVLLPVLFLYGMRLARQSREEGAWVPKLTAETSREAEPSEAHPTSRWAIYGPFAAYAAILFACGVVIALSGAELAARFGISQSVAGAYATAIPTSLPELVTVLAAVRRGALNLAVGDIVGGNCFDVLFVFVSDVAYPNGSVFHAVGRTESFLIAANLVLTAVLALGLLRREKHGVGNVGSETIGLFGVYALTGLLVAFL